MMYKPDRRLIKGERIGIGVETAQYKISGKAFLHKDRRFSDLLNQNEKGFLVLTEAKIFPLNGQEVLSEKEYLVVNKDSIVLAWEE